MTDISKPVNPDLPDSWRAVLLDEFYTEGFKKLREFLVEERENHTIYPPGSLIFEAFNRTPLDRVRCVILGQDPYHGAGQAHGLCFSVSEGVKPPPSLVNIFKELESDLGIQRPESGNLSYWADQGVFLLNATLTVRANSPGSHQQQGWESFTDAVIQIISNELENVVFLLWGKYAGEKSNLIDDTKHLVLKSPHPSPFSARRGFFGCRHFSKANDYLNTHGKGTIDWDLNNASA